MVLYWPGSQSTYVSSHYHLQCVNQYSQTTVEKPVYFLTTLEKPLYFVSDEMKPEFVDCPTSVSVRLYESLETLLTPPTVTDNSGAVASFNVSNNLRDPVTKNMNITWSAADHAGNEADLCQVEVQLKGIHLLSILSRRVSWCVAVQGRCDVSHEHVKSCGRPQ